MIDYHIDVSRHLITTRAAGHVSYAELAAYLHRLYRDPHFAPDLDGLIVAMDPDVVPTPLSIALLKPLIRAWSGRRAGAKWAIVMPDAATKDRAELLLHELKLAVPTRCFTSEASALAWLEPAARAAG